MDTTEQNVVKPKGNHLGIVWVNFAWPLEPSYLRGDQLVNALVRKGIPLDYYAGGIHVAVTEKRAGANVVYQYTDEPNDPAVVELFKIALRGAPFEHWVPSGFCCRFERHPELPHEYEVYDLAFNLEGGSTQVTGYQYVELTYDDLEYEDRNKNPKKEKETANG